MPGAFLIVATASTSSVLDASPSEPLRSTIARFGAARVDERLAEAPVHAEASRSTTPTTPAMPITTTHDAAEPARDAAQVHPDDCADLPKNAHDCFLRSRSVDSAARERVDDVERLRAPRGRQRAHDRDGRGDRDAGADDAEREATSRPRRWR